MRQLLCGIAAVALLAGVSSCNEKSRLADEMTGTWSSAPERLMDNAASSATIVENYTFIRNGNETGGDVTLSALISVTGSISGTDAIIQPFSLSAGAIANISGTWSAIDDDEIRLDWNDSTLTVSVDPSAVTISVNNLTGKDIPTVDSLRPQLAESIRAQIKQAVEVRFLGTRRFDDIKIKNGEMKYEVNDADRILRLQGPVSN